MISHLLRHCASIFALSAILASAASSQTTKTYTLDECIRTGLKNNTNLLRGGYDLDRAASIKRQAFGRFLPSVGASANWSRSNKEQVALLPGAGIVRSRDNFSYSISSELTLFDGLSNIYNADRSVLGVQASEFALLRSKQDVVYAIQQGFFNGLRMQQLVRVNQSNLERSRKQLERIRELNSVGSIPLADVYRQQVQVGQDELRLLQSENEYANGLVDLQIALGLSPGVDFEIDATGIPSTIDSTEVVMYRSGLGSVSGLAGNAMRTRADVQQAELNVRSAEKSVSIASAGHLPSLSAFAGYSWNNIELKQFTNEDYTRLSYGLNLSIPIFSGFSVSTAVQQAEVERRVYESHKLDLERTVAGSLQKAMNSLGAAEKNLEISTRTLQSAREDQRIASERYTLGAGTLLDLIIANANFTVAESDVVNARFDYLIARKQLEYQLGTTDYSKD